MYTCIAGHKSSFSRRPKCMRPRCRRLIGLHSADLLSSAEAQWPGQKLLSTPASQRSQHQSPGRWRREPSLARRVHFGRATSLEHVRLADKTVNLSDCEEAVRMNSPVVPFCSISMISPTLMDNSFQLGEL